MRIAKTEDEFATLPGARLINQQHVFSSGSTTSYLFSLTNAYANLFRVRLPE